MKRERGNSQGSINALQSVTAQTDLDDRVDMDEIQALDLVGL